ncbi:Trihelix transcription factor ASIL2 [Sesamum alatum]|uniref:Trihelix transcription factor ASIL2 n=1 Tax=Sesamum alatum TaxID=300844 RepID=A0AAE1XLY1_9LAMI|nr:Trihelix transcription factor ASIL2 [Sesamum alatum]
MMDDEDDVGYRPSSYAINGQKFPVEDVSYPRQIGNSYVEDDDDDGVDDDDEKGVGNAEDEDEDEDEGNGVQRIGQDEYEYDDEDDNKDDDYGDLQSQPKKRKLKTLFSNYEFAPRVPAPSAAAALVTKPSYGGRNPLTDWTEHETFVLLDAWGDRFLKQGRKSLRSEEWQEVAEKVSQESRIERTDTQCRNRLDTLKKKYKKEKMKSGETGGSASEWVYFKKMDTLLSSQPQQSGLSCAVDSGEYAFMDPKVYSNCSNGLDEMRDSPGNSEFAEHEEDESNGLPPPKKMKNNGKLKDSPASFKLLADSFKKFSEIYEKIENSKRKQMLELEKMRMDFHKDLELQKRQILERAQAEIAKIWEGDDEDNVVSAENLSG